MRLLSIRAATSLATLASVTAQVSCSVERAHPPSVVIAAPIAGSSADEPTAPVPQRAEKRRQKAGFLEIGETAHRRDFDLTLSAVRPCEPRYYEKASLKKAEHRLVGVEVTFEATTNKPFTPATYEMKLIDSEGVTYTYSFRGTCEPRFQSYSLDQEGMRASGWVTFEIATGSRGLEFHYGHESDEVVKYDLGS
ncbi:MAG: DUF4352 domain-containing protein [Polyangiaceae bacterium]